MESKTVPHLDYATQKPRLPPLAWQSVCSFVGAAVSVSMFTCTCGHLAQMALIGTVTTAVFAWWGFVRELPLLGRIFASVATVLASYLLVKNVLDILWFGHNPLLR
jgi:hypothetical protein